MAQSNNDFLQRLKDIGAETAHIAKEALPFVAIAAIGVATGGEGAVVSAIGERIGGEQIAYNVASFLESNGKIGQYASTVLDNVASKNLGKSAWTIYKRVLAQDLIRSATSKNYSTTDALKDSFDTTSWITNSLLFANITKASIAPGVAKVKGFLPEGNGTLSGLQDMVGIYRSKLTDSVNDMLGLTPTPVVDKYTGEILFREQTKMQQFKSGVVHGAANQLVATQVFRSMIGHPYAARAAWSTALVQNLDELYLPTTSSNTSYQHAMLALRMFDVSTVQKNSFGTYSRLKRGPIVKGAIDTAKNPQHLQTLISNTIQPQGAGRLVGALAARGALIIAGEDQKVVRAYATSNYKKSNKDAGLVTVAGYYRDGFYVKGYKRKPRHH